jgi:hypothetical protein
MRLPAFFLSLVLVGMLSGCATATKDITIETRSAPGVNLAAYKTYAWLTPSAIATDQYQNWEAPGVNVNAELRQLIAEQLRNKGMQEATTAPDLVIAFAAGVNRQIFEMAENPETDMLNLRNAAKGALVVVMIDPATRYPVWVGRAVGSAKAGRTPEEIRKRLRYAVRTMFEQ